MILLIISITLFALYSLLMILYGYGWRRQKKFMLSSAGPGREKISVLIPARNEAQHIAACIRSILDNDFPKAQLEILVIDDYSTDATAQLAAETLQEHGRVLRLADYLDKGEPLNAYKKKALEIAIAQATGHWILTTDADCCVPNNWLSTMSNAGQHPDIQFMAAPVSFTPFKGKKSLLYYFQSLDFMTMQGITVASIKLDLGNMCNGANLAFRKTAFAAVGGYKDIDHIASGDDMLLMYKMQQHFPDGIRYIKSTEAIVHTPAQGSWLDFLNQRIRWSSKAGKYQEKKLTWILAIVYCFNLQFLPLLVAGLFHTYFLSIALGLLLLKTLIEMIFLIPVARFYNKTNELFLFPLLQPLHIIYIITAGFLGKFGHYKWKDRKVT